MSNPFADADPSKTPLPAEAANDRVNPYASPLTPSESKPELIAIWREGKYVVAHRNATFPPICIRSNEPAKRAYRCQLTWSYPIDFSKRYVTFDVGLCESCIRRHTRRRVFGWLLLLASVVLVGIVIAIGLPGSVVVLAILGAILAVSLVLGPAVSLTVKKVKQPYFWIRGANPKFLNRLPTSPPPPG